MVPATKDAAHVQKDTRARSAIRRVGIARLLERSLLKIVRHYLVTTPSPPPLMASTPSRPVLTAQTVGLIGPRKGQLIDYGRLLGARAGPIGWLLAPLAAFLLAIPAIAFAARKCAQGGCVPGGGRYIPVTVGTTGATQTDRGMARMKVIIFHVVSQAEANVQRATCN